MSSDPRPSLLLVLGPTGSGKSDLAHEVARRRDGEIVSADAFAVYRGLDVGTAKPSEERRREVRYHLIDVAEPSESYSAGRWAKEARAAVEEIAARGRLPIVCGGSGFYVSALLEGLPEGDARALELREALLRWSEGRELAAYRFLERNDPVAATRIAPANSRAVLRALEILLVTGRAPSSRLPIEDPWAERFRIVKAGVARARSDLYARIARRVREMLDSGWEREVGGLVEAGISADSNAFVAIGYRELAAAIRSGSPDRVGTEGEIVRATRRLAKRQQTWFRREREVVWMTPDEALDRTLALLDGNARRERGG